MAQGGRLNATTWFDRTNYFETVPKGAVELALWLEADRHGRLLDAVDAGEPRQPARRGQGGEAPALRQRALRQRADRGVCRGLPRGAPLPPPDDRLDGGPRRRQPRRRPRLLPGRTTAPTTRCSPCAATSRRSTGSPPSSATSATCPRGAVPRRPDHAQLAPLDRAGARRAARGRAQRPAARRVPAPRRRHRRVRRRLGRARLPRGPVDLTAGAAGWCAASRPRCGAHATPWGFVDGASLGFVVLDVADGQDPARVEADCRRGARAASSSTAPPRSSSRRRWPSPSGPGSPPSPARRSVPT